MSSVVLTDQYKVNWASRTGIPDDQVVETVSNPDATETVNFPEADLVVSAKRYAMGRLPFTLVARSKRQHGLSSVEMCVKVYDDLAPRVDAMGPGDMLDALAQQFGLPVAIAGRVQKFFRNESVPLTGDQQVDQLTVQSLPPHQQLMFNATIRKEDGPPAAIQCLYVFCLNALLYKSWLQVH